MDGPHGGIDEIASEASVRGEAPRALLVEGALNPINSMQSEPGWPQIIMGTPLRRQSGERSVPTHPSESKAARGVSPHEAAR